MSFFSYDFPVLVTFRQSDKISESNNLEEGFILPHCFRVFSSYLPGSIALRLRKGKLSWPLECVEEETIHLIAAEKWSQKE
jgi:hypothetical protein